MMFACCLLMFAPSSSRCGGGKLVNGGLREYERIKRKTLVFVGGAHYSGTSLLEAVLSTSPLTSVSALRAGACAASAANSVF